MPGVQSPAPGGWLSWIAGRQRVRAGLADRPVSHIRRWWLSL